MKSDRIIEIKIRANVTTSFSEERICELLSPYMKVVEIKMKPYVFSLRAICSILYSRFWNLVLKLSNSLFRSSAMVADKTIAQPPFLRNRQSE